MIKPVVASDLEAYLLIENKKQENIYCIGSLEYDCYIEAKESQKDAIMKTAHYFDGKNTLNEISSKLQREEKMMVDIEKLYDLFREAGLIVDEHNREIKKNELEKYGIQIASIDLKQIQNVLNVLGKYANILGTVGLIIIVSTVPLMYNILKRIMLFNIYRTVDSSIISFILSVLITTGSVLLHELSHAIWAKRYGLSPLKMNITLYLYVNPMAYIKIPGIYTLSKRKRIVVWGSGILCNLILFSIAIIVGNYSKGILNNLSILTCYTNLGLIITNIIPFLPLDGYFLLSTIVKIPNLRKKSFLGIKSILKNKSIKIKIIYIVYYVISIVVLSYLIIAPVVQASYNFMITYSAKNSLLDGLIEIWMYFAIPFIMIISHLFTKIKNYHKIRN